MADEQKDKTTLYTVPGGEAVEFDPEHAENLLKTEKALGFNNFSPEKPADKPAPTDATKRSASNSDGPKTGAGAPASPQASPAG